MGRTSQGARCCQIPTIGTHPIQAGRHKLDDVTVSLLHALNATHMSLFKQVCNAVADPVTCGCTLGVVEAPPETRSHLTDTLRHILWEEPLLLPPTVIDILAVMLCG